MSGVACTVGVRVLPLLGAVCWDREVHFEVGIHVVGGPGKIETGSEQLHSQTVC